MKKIALFLVAMTAIPVFVSASIDTNLKYGARGTEVTELQEFLISKGFLFGTASGNFFSLTKKAVIVYQQSVNLPATGYVGSRTRSAINQELAQTDASSTQAEITETGTTTLPVQTDQIALLLQQIKLLQQQIDAQKQTRNLQTQQNTQLQQTLNQIAQNTTQSTGSSVGTSVPTSSGTTTTTTASLPTSTATSTSAISTSSTPTCTYVPSGGGTVLWNCTSVTSRENDSDFIPVSGHSSATLSFHYTNPSVGAKGQCQYRFRGYDENHNQIYNSTFWYLPGEGVTHPAVSGVTANGYPNTDCGATLQIPLLMPPTVMASDGEVDWYTASSSTSTSGIMPKYIKLDIWTAGAVGFLSGTVELNSQTNTTSPNHPIPPPTVTLSANPISIISGQSSTLNWSSTYATSCSGTGFTTNGVSGSVTVTPLATTNYSIACTGTGGVASASTTVTVIPPSISYTLQKASYNHFGPSAPINNTNTAYELAYVVSPSVNNPVDEIKVHLGGNTNDSDVALIYLDTGAGHPDYNGSNLNDVKALRTNGQYALVSGGVADIHLNPIYQSGIFPELVIIFNVSAVGKWTEASSVDFYYQGTKFTQSVTVM